MYWYGKCVVKIESYICNYFGIKFGFEYVRDWLMRYILEKNKILDSII